jgi:hypothetical protein
MASFLDRFAQIEKEVEAEVIDVSDEHSDSEAKVEAEWHEKKNYSIFSPSKSNITFRETVIKRVPKENLVWAPCYNIKGSNPLIFARICNISDTITSTDERIKWPIPDDHVVVEYLSVPKAFPQFAEIAGKLIHRFDEPLKGKPIEVNEWNSERCKQAVVIYKRKFTTHIAENIVAKGKQTADEFLRCVCYFLFGIITYGVVSTCCSRLALEMDAELTGGPKHVVASEVLEIEEEGDLDMARFALRCRLKKSKEPLQAGDTVEYECDVSL